MSVSVLQSVAFSAGVLMDSTETIRYMPAALAVAGGVATGVVLGEDGGPGMRTLVVEAKGKSGG